MQSFSLKLSITIVSAALLGSPLELLAIQNLDRLIGTQTRLLRHQATEQQRKVATARARAYVASQRSAEAKRTKIAKAQEPPTKAKEPATKPKGGDKMSSKTEPRKKEADEEKVVAKRKTLPRYIAVDTVKDNLSPPKTKKAVMIWDTRSEALVGNDVYDLQSPPPVGSTAKFETYSAEYVGSGG